MDRKFIAAIAQRLQEQQKIFKDKPFLDPTFGTDEIVGREKQAESIVRYIGSYKNNFVVPLVSIHGITGSGKSTLVSFVCDSFKDEIAYCFVNLRRAKTIFGSANLILGELGIEDVKSSQGINAVLDRVEYGIEQASSGKRLFVLVLDEFDVIFFDKRNSASDFVYKLLTLQENLKKKNILSCIITISNNILTDYELDQRVRSRIGTSEIFFEPYTKEDIVKILSKRALSALADGVIDDATIDYCAEQSSLGHGDARRAIDLLRVSAELASVDGDKILQKHVDAAMDKLQRDVVTDALAASSYHHRVVLFGLARLCYLLDEDWQSTSRIYSQYQKFVSSKVRQLSYKSIALALIDLENTGLLKHKTSSAGRHGRSTQFYLTDLPENVGSICFPDAWKGIVIKKREHDAEMKELMTPAPMHNPKSPMVKTLIKFKEEEWRKYVGI